MSIITLKSRFMQKVMTLVSAKARQRFAQLARLNADIQQSRSERALELIHRRWYIDNMPATTGKIECFQEWKQSVADFMNHESAGV